MMAGACLAPLIALVLSATPDAAALVARLGSDRAAEREEAAKALEMMGRGALPALVDAAKGATDPEIRSRVLGIWDGIQKDSMRKPTLVRIDARGLPLEKAVHALGEQAGFTLEWRNQGRQEVVNVQEPQPIPFWRAVERLGFSGGYYHQVLPPDRNFPTIQFSELDKVSPSVISGPFLIQLTGLHDERDRYLVQGPSLRIDQMNQRIPIPRGSKESESRFYADFRLMVEPRMWFTQEGPVRVIEATDDLGQSLVPPAGPKNEADHSLNFNGGGVADGRGQLDLMMPARPGRTITRLRGAIPVALQIQRPLPSLEIPLASAKGKTFAHDEAAFTIRDFEQGPGGATISLDIRLEIDRAELPEPRYPELISSRLHCLSNHQLEFVDAEGKSLDTTLSGSWGPNGHGKYHVSASKQLNRTSPASMRYYSMVRAFTDVTFEFENLPMP